VNIRRVREAIAAAKADYINAVRTADPALANSLERLRVRWYDMRNEVDEDTSEVFIYEGIGGWFGIPASEFVQDLNKIKTKNINVRINSPGGSVFDSVAIYNALVAHTASVNVQIDSLAASGASIIAMAGDKITMMVGSQLMIHDASGIEMGDARMMREMADFLDAQSDNISTIYAARTGGEPADYRTMMLKETWMFAAEAVELGLADEIYSKPEKSTEEEKPESETDKPDEEEPEKDSEKDGDEEGVPSEEELDDLMKKWPTTSGRGFKYESRLASPKPADLSEEDELDRILAAWN
jgi:ATP-dependent protease ClpP protease subunit